jgi:hypothetical protein
MYDEVIVRVYSKYDKVQVKCDNRSDGFDKDRLLTDSPPMRNPRMQGTHRIQRIRGVFNYSLIPFSGRNIHPVFATARSRVFR